MPEDGSTLALAGPPPRLRTINVITTGATGIESGVGKGSTRGPLSLNHMPLLRGKAACLSRGSPDVSGLPDLDDRLQGKQSRSRADTRVRCECPAASCGSGVARQPPRQGSRAGNCRGLSSPAPPADRSFIRTPATLLLHSKKIADN